MLTNDDLKAIRKVVREEVVAEVKDVSVNIEGRVRESKLFVQADISRLEDKIKNVEIRVDNVSEDVETRITKRLKPVNRTLDYIKKTLDVAISRFDESDVKLEKRVKRIEDNITLPETN